MKPNQRCSTIIGAVTLMGSCATPSLPITNFRGAGIAPGSTISFLGEGVIQSDLSTKIRGKVDAQLVASGYRVQPTSDFAIEYSIAQRSPAIGVLLPSQNTSSSEVGIWRSRPIDPKAFPRCKTSIYRVMVVVSKRASGEVVYRGSSDDEACEEISDEKLGILVRLSLSKLSGAGAS